MAFWQSSSEATAIKAFSLQNGKELGTVANLPQFPAQVVGPYRASDGALWFTVTNGPKLRSDAAGGDPAPNSCSGSVIRFDPATGKSQTELVAPTSELVGPAVPSPDGKRLAYLAGGCTTSFLNMHIVVRKLSTGEESTVGIKAMPCHFMSAPSWNADGSKLTFGFEPSPLKTGSTFIPRGTCDSPLSGEVAVVPSASSSEITTDELVPAAAGCGYRYSVFDRAGVAAVETCGDQGLGAATLAQLDGSGKVAGRFGLHPGSDPTSLAADKTGAMVLVNEYQAPEVVGNKVMHGAYVWIQLFDGQSLRTIARYNGDVVGLREATF